MNGSLDERMVYDNARNAIVSAFGGNSDVLNTAILTQSNLRLEALLATNVTLYTFPVLDQGATGNTTNMELRLKLQDAFVISSIKVCTGAPSGATDNTFLPDSYANQIKYGANAAPLQAIWNAGTLSINVNRTPVVPEWDLYRHYNAPETQQTAALGAGSPMDQDRGSFDGWYPMEPNVTLIGSKNSILNVNLRGAGLSAVLANSRLIILLRGVLAQNITPVS